MHLCFNELLSPDRWQSDDDVHSDFAIVLLPVAGPVCSVFGFDASLVEVLSIRILDTGDRCSAMAPVAHDYAYV